MADKFQHPALVLGMFETGLGVIRSLGQVGINVFGFDYKKDIAFYSKYVKAIKCPHPLKQEVEFISFMITFSCNSKSKPIVFITSDIFLMSVSRNREQLMPYYMFNLPSDSLIESISNKYRQYLLTKKVGISLPTTFLLNSTENVETLKNKLPYPVLIKALDVNDWRDKVSGSVKGFVAGTPEYFVDRCFPLLAKNVKLVVQEIIEGPDINHYKYCAYYSPKGVPLCEFTLQKIRQNPIHFGVGSVVESISYNALMVTGRKLFKSIGYSGIGSAEFKLDQKDGQLKLIEINPRYWQQNYLSTACGINFPLIDYQTLTGQNIENSLSFETGIKWVNLYLDFVSFLDYRNEKKISLKEWVSSLRGKKVYSDFNWDDILPGGYELNFGLKLIKIPMFLFKRIRKHFLS